MNNSEQELMADLRKTSNSDSDRIFDTLSTSSVGDRFNEVEELTFRKIKMTQCTNLDKRLSSYGGVICRLSPNWNELNRVLCLFGTLVGTFEEMDEGLLEEKVAFFDEARNWMPLPKMSHEQIAHYRVWSESHSEARGSRSQQESLFARTKFSLAIALPFDHGFNRETALLKRSLEKWRQIQALFEKECQMVEGNRAIDHNIHADPQNRIVVVGDLSSCKHEFDEFTVVLFTQLYGVMAEVLDREVLTTIRIDEGGTADAGMNCIQFKILQDGGGGTYRTRTTIEAAVRSFILKSVTGKARTKKSTCGLEDGLLRSRIEEKKELLTERYEERERRMMSSKKQRGLHARLGYLQKDGRDGVALGSSPSGERCGKEAGFPGNQCRSQTHTKLPCNRCRSQTLYNVA
ncbi:hypothetical protein GALMADRAFT_215164 [Galerina marginata CBS 339.88]|uniref:Uncharacterized protein n=1 Tax=Galerina marginata (strain CBS 339.88) TaxID=685588 RepID=A0A067SPB2_GALM3|nr:hypothetical protein GALMADRAFT_215164 [Galerina marginata CBS 339.88]